jgi:hypothetical protein
MQYLISVIDDGTGLATPTEEADINAFNDRLRAEGHWVFAGGLGSPDPATVIDNRGDEAVFTDGPFVGRQLRGSGYALSRPTPTPTLAERGRGRGHASWRGRRC